MTDRTEITMASGEVFGVKLPPAEAIDHLLAHPAGRGRMRSAKDKTGKVVMWDAKSAPSPPGLAKAALDEGVRVRALHDAQGDDEQ